MDLAQFYGTLNFLALLQFSGIIFGFTIAA
jgi:hypothetical protein